MTFFWDNTKISILKNYIQEGLSSSKIGTLMGTTKGSVIGKCAREGIKTHFLPGYGVRGQNELLSDNESQETILYGIDIFCLSPKTCRWPLWKDETPQEHRRYCGGDVSVGETYCATHKKISYNETARQRQALMRIS